MLVMSEPMRYTLHLIHSLVFCLVQGPITPIATLERNPELPLLIEIVAGDMPVVTGLEVWAAVVVRDTSGNAYLDDLVVVSTQSKDDGFDEAGDYITPVDDLDADWVDDGILVSWEELILEKSEAIRYTSYKNHLPLFPMHLKLEKY